MSNAHDSSKSTKVRIEIDLKIQGEDADLAIYLTRTWQEVLGAVLSAEPLPVGTVVIQVSSPEFQDILKILPDGTIE